MAADGQPDWRKLNSVKWCGTLGARCEVRKTEVEEQSNEPILRGARLSQIPESWNRIPKTVTGRYPELLFNNFSGDGIVIGLNYD